MHSLKLAVLAVIASSATSALATNPNIVHDVLAVPPTVTRSQVSLQTFASYQIKIKNASQFAAKSVEFTGKTAVLNGGGANAPFVSASGATCAPVYAPPSTKVRCQIGNLAGWAEVSFSVTFAAPASGTQIDLTSQTFHQRVGSYYVFHSPEKVTSTDLEAPNPLQVATFLPAATGGTIFTGSNGGVAVSADKATTKVNVPSSATAAIDETPVTGSPVCPGAPVCPPNSSRLTIPGMFDHLTITLRIDVSAVPKKHDGRDSDDDDDDARGNGHGDKHVSKIAKAKVFYQPDPTPENQTPQFAEVYPCSITGGPVEGRPCIASRTAYTKKTAPTPDFVGDWEFVIFAVDNGRFQF